MMRQHKCWLMMVILPLLGTGLGWGLITGFPSLDRAFLDWELRTWSHAPLHPQLVMIEAPTERTVGCEEGPWHPDQVSTLLEGLSQVGVSVVGFLDHLPVTGAPDCGGLGSVVRLAETTKRIGRVVYPQSVPQVLKDVAWGTGRVNVIPEDDGVVRGLRMVTDQDVGTDVPLGFQIASRAQSLSFSPSSTKHVPPFQYFPSPQGTRLPRYTYRQVHDWIQEADFDALEHHFQNKIVLLTTHHLSSQQDSTVWSPEVPLSTLHAWMANVALTQSWLLPVPFGLAWLAIWSLGGVVVFSFLGNRSWMVRSVMALVVLFGASLAIVVGVGAGWLWPLGWSVSSVLFVLVSAVVYKVLVSRKGVQEKIHEGEQVLKALQSDLARKQEVVGELEAKLHHAKFETESSVSMISELHESRKAILQQLQDSEKAMGKTCEHILQLETELESLRQRVPVAHSSSESAIQPNQRTLIQECASLHILTKDSTMLEIFQKLKKAAATNSPILLLGETGTGKEVFARAAHDLSVRKQAPFISVNMAALRPELFEGELFGHVKGAYTGAVGREGLLRAAHGGTIFFDEIGEIPFDVQAKLLRVLEDGVFFRVGDNQPTRVDVRVVAATNRDLPKMVERGAYREDLYYRLRSIVLTLPPLRERDPEDRVLLADWFLAKRAEQQSRECQGFTQGAIDAILAYHWPGNIRELRQTIAQALALGEGPVITASQLQLPELPVRDEDAQLPRGKHMDWGEDAMVLDSLRHHDFDMGATARALRWDRSTVTQRLKGMGFQALVEHRLDVRAAARALAGKQSQVRVVEGRLREYLKNLLPSTRQYQSADEAIADCRKRFRNLPDRHFPAVERLIQERFLSPSS